VELDFQWIRIKYLEVKLSESFIKSLGLLVPGSLVAHHLVKTGKGEKKKKIWEEPSLSE